MDRFFIIFGKAVLILIVLSGIAYGGYYFGTQTKDISKPEAVKIEDNNIIAISPTPSATNKPLITINGGVPKSSGLSFDQYSLKASSDWKVSKENQTNQDEKLILSKDGYTISIFQAATGGAMCLYDGDPDFEGPSSRFKTYKELTTQDLKILRRSSNLNATTFTICQKGQDGSFQQPTNYGHISVKLPGTWDADILDEIDQILASLKKI